MNLVVYFGFDRVGPFDSWFIASSSLCIFWKSSLDFDKVNHLCGFWVLILPLDAIYQDNIYINHIPAFFLLIFTRRISIDLKKEIIFKIYYRIHFLLIEINIVIFWAYFSFYLGYGKRRNINLYKPQKEAFICLSLIKLKVIETEINSFFCKLS